MATKNSHRSLKREQKTTLVELGHSAKTPIIPAQTNFSNMNSVHRFLGLHLLRLMRTTCVVSVCTDGIFPIQFISIIVYGLKYNRLVGAITRNMQSEMILLHLLHTGISISFLRIFRLNQQLQLCRQGFC